MSSTLTIHAHRPVLPVGGGTKPHLCPLVPASWLMKSDGSPVEYCAMSRFSDGIPPAPSLLTPPVTVPSYYPVVASISKESNRVNQYCKRIKRMCCARQLCAATATVVQFLFHAFANAFFV